MTRFFYQKIILFSFVFALFYPVSLVQAEQISFFSDPVFVASHPDALHPLQDLIDLKNNGDARAQFILADLYSKGKGGFIKDPNQAKILFEKSARQGFKHGFIRLAALCKKDNSFKEAYKWYSLAIDAYPYGETRSFLVRARNQLSRDFEMSKRDIRDAKRSVKKWLTTKVSIHKTTINLDKENKS